MNPTKLSWLIVLIFVNKINGDILVQLPNGTIRGRTATTPNNNSFFAFQQIPYAAPPIGDLRFKPPSAAANWEGILNTTENTKICYIAEETWDMETEDCLYINVFTPQLPPLEENFPVMFFIHGGGFIGGNALYEAFGPEFLVEQGVVVVTFSYRLGPFGFLSTIDYIIRGNNGLKDQLFALQWVNQNIHLFGGDPEKVILFGQSAGAAAVGLHLMSLKSTGLYRGAIMESGSPLSSFSLQRNAAEYAFKTAAYINDTFNENDSPYDLLDFLQQASAEDIDAASYKVVKEQYYDNIQILQGFYYGPVIEKLDDDGEAFIYRGPYEFIADGNFTRVPVIIGMTSEEGIGQAEDLESFQKMMVQFDDHLDWLVPFNMHAVEGSNFSLKIGEEIRKMYVGEGRFQDNLGAGVRYFSDNGFGRSIIKHAIFHSYYQTAYLYQFSYNGEMGNVNATVDGAGRVGHSEEIPYLWRVNSGNFNNYDLSKFPKEDIVTLQRMVSLWTNFAKTLNPTPEPSDLLQNVTWSPIPRWDPENVPYLDIGSDLKMHNHLKQGIMDAWDDLYGVYGSRPFDTY